MWPDSDLVMKRQQSYLLRPGDQVIVCAPLVLASRPMVEGRARLVEPVPHIPNLWRVQFAGERNTRLRFVHEADPHRTLAIAMDHYRATLDSALLADLFPLGPRDDGNSPRGIRK